MQSHEKFVVLNRTEILKNLKKLSKTSRKTYASKSHEIQEETRISPKCIWYCVIPLLLPTDSACSPVTTLQISHPFHMVPLRTPAGFHQLLTGEVVFTCFISPNRGKVLRLSKAGYAENHLNSVIKGQQRFWKANMEEQTADYFLTGIVKCQADSANSTTGCF